MSVLLDQPSSLPTLRWRLPALVPRIHQAGLSRRTDFHFSDASHFSCTVLPPRQIIPMLFKGLELSLGICGIEHMRIIMPHLAARALLK